MLCKVNAWRFIDGWAMTKPGRTGGRYALIRCNPEDISHCWAFTPDGDRSKPIARLEANERIIPGTCADDASEAIAVLILLPLACVSLLHPAGREDRERILGPAEPRSEEAM